MTLLLLAACGAGPEAPRSSGRGLVVIAVDGLRADHLSCLGYDRETTPRLDQRAAAGLVFEAAFSAAPLRTPAHCALLSGSDPNLARRAVPQWLEATLDQTWLLPAAAPRLPLELAGLGFDTAAFSSHPEFSRVFGFAIGFHEFIAPWESRGGTVPSAELLSRAAQWIRRRGDQRDWFAYLELSDLEGALGHPDPEASTFFAPRPELDYLPPFGTERPALFALPPERFDGSLRTMGEFEARYDGALRRLDEELDGFFDELELSGRLEKTTICVLGSYGMQFGEAGLFADNGRLSMADLHVPLVILPSLELSIAQRGRRSDLFSTIDLAPSLLTLFGAPIPNGMLGADRLGLDAKVRSECFASCAIQGGYAAIGERLCLELVFGSAVSSSALERAWFGELGVHPDEISERLYDWRKDPFPPLSASPLPVQDQGQGLKAAAAAHIRLVDALRERYQEPILRIGFGDRAAQGGAPP